MLRFDQSMGGSRPPGADGGPPSGGSGGWYGGGSMHPFHALMILLQQAVNDEAPEEVERILNELHTRFRERLNRVVQVAGTGHLESNLPVHARALPVLWLLVRALVLVEIQSLPSDIPLPVDRLLRQEHGEQIANELFVEMAQQPPLSLMACFPDLAEYVNQQVMIRVQTNVRVTITELVSLLQNGLRA